MYCSNRKHNEIFPTRQTTTKRHEPLPTSPKAARGLLTYSTANFTPAIDMPDHEAENIRSLGSRGTVQNRQWASFRTHSAPDTPRKVETSETPPATISTKRVRGPPYPSDPVDHARLIARKAVARRPQIHYVVSTFGTFKQTDRQKKRS